MASVASPAPSPSPTPPPVQSSSPHHHAPQHSTKAGALVSVAKSILSEQSVRLALKHNTDLDLLDDLRLYLKTRCSIERDYAQALAKLNSAHSKRSSPLLTFVAAEDGIADVKTVYTAWKVYQEEMEKHSKARVAVFDTLSSVCDQLKAMRLHKVHVSKKCLDTHLKKMQEEIVNSVMEIDKTRKLYFEEEHLAKQARDKEEKIKKRKTGIFSSLANLQTKKERTSAHREASDIQSTQARNDYIMALAAGNAHLQHYYGQDLPNLMFSIDDTSLDKCRSFILNLLQTEREMANSWSDVIERSTELMSQASADHTNSVCLRDPNSNAINSETLLYEFQPCDNDSCDFISLDHNADIALRNEGQKWFTWFSKECRNLNRLSAQLVRVQAMQSEGHKSVEVTGNGQVDIETRIDEIRQQIRKCEISKMKAKARLQIIRESGAEVEDFDSFETQVTMEIKQQSLDVDINLGSLSRTPSVRSNMGSEAPKSPIPKADPDSVASIITQTRPESSSSAEQLDSPDREVLQLGSSLECTSPAPGSAALSAATAAGWDSYDPTQVAWDEEPAPTAAAASFNGYDQDNNNQTANDYGANNSSMEDTTENGGGQLVHEHEAHDYVHYQQVVDGFTLVGKSCFVLYAYSGSGEDELTIIDQEIVSVIDASDKDWVRAQNEQGSVGYVPAAYLQALPDQSVDQQQLDSTLLSQTSAVVSSNSVDSEQDKMTTPPESMPLYPESPMIITSTTTNTSSESENQPLPPPPENMAEYVRALYPYEASNPEEISFGAGELIRIVDNSSDDGWWTGESKDGVVGHFPSMLVVSLDDDDDDEDEDDEAASEDEENEDDEESSSQTTSVPPSISLPPVAPPIPSTTITTTTTECCATNGENQPNAVGSTAPIGAPAAPPPTFAPPPKPMSLMAPQTVVIIQPTPEIESRPALGSEEFGQAVDANQATATGSSDREASSSVTVTGTRKSSTPVEVSANGELETTITVSMAIAAQEVSSTITQNAMDDSMRELSRRTSGSSSGSVHEAPVQDGAPVVNGPAAGGAAAGPQPNGHVVQRNQNNDHDDEEEEDCK